MRKPRIHSLLRLNNLKGLSNVLTNKDTDWADCIQKIDNFGQISVLTSGITPPDPARLINSKRMKETIQSIKNSNKFDVILFDAPPIVGISDSTLLSEFLDGIILLVSLETVPRNIPLESIKQIRKFNGNLLGIVTNETKEILMRKTSRSYGYGYGYGYYYDNNEENKDEKDFDEQLEENFIEIIKTKIKLVLSSSLKWFDS